MTEEMTYIGWIVRPRSGRDRRRFYAVVKVDIEKGRMYIANGGLRRLERPKAKTPKHLEFVSYSEEIAGSLTDGSATDETLRKLLLNAI